jgi:hypothetical protein
MQRSVLYGKHDSEAGCHGFAVHEGLVLGNPANQKSGAMIDETDRMLTR